MTPWVTAKKLATFGQEVTFGSSRFAVDNLEENPPTFFPPAHFFSERAFTEAIT